MIELTLSLVLFLFPLAYSPGPGNMLFAANGARFGVAATIPANMGYHVATWIVTVAIGLGFASLVDISPKLFVAIKWVGSAYVLFLAWKLITAGTVEGSEAARPAGFMAGVVVLLFNPKAYLIIALMFSQFLVGTQTNYVAAVIWISTVFTLNNYLAFTVWSVAGNQIAVRFRDKADARRLNWFFGAVLAAVAFWMMLR